MSHKLPLCLTLPIVTGCNHSRDLTIASSSSGSSVLQIQTEHTQSGVADDYGSCAKRLLTMVALPGGFLGTFLRVKQETGNKSFVNVTKQTEIVLIAMRYVKKQQRSHRERRLFCSINILRVQLTY